MVATDNTNNIYATITTNCSRTTKKPIVNKQSTCAPLMPKKNTHEPREVGACLAAQHVGNLPTAGEDYSRAAKFASDIISHYSVFAHALLAKVFGILYAIMHCVQSVNKIRLNCRRRDDSGEFEVASTVSLIRRRSSV